MILLMRNKLPDHMQAVDYTTVPGPRADLNGLSLRISTLKSSEAAKKPQDPTPHRNSQRVREEMSKGRAQFNFANKYGT